MNPIASSYANKTVSLFFISWSDLFPMCLNPVSVSVKFIPSDFAIVLRILEETVDARKWTLSSGEFGFLFLWHFSNHQPSRAPISFPDNIFHESFLNFWATPSLSASGSLARIYFAPFVSAFLKERSRALAPSSGFGKSTVENSGSGSFCSSTTRNFSSGKP